MFVVEEKPHARLRREEDDVVAVLDVPLVDALAGAGGSRTVEHLDGRKVTVQLPKGVSRSDGMRGCLRARADGAPPSLPQVIKPSQETRIAGEGFPITKAGSIKKKGDMVVRWNVVFPETVTPAQAEAVRKALA